MKILDFKQLVSVSGGNVAEGNVTEGMQNDTNPGPVEAKTANSTTPEMLSTLKLELLDIIKECNAGSKKYLTGVQVIGVNDCFNCYRLNKVALDLENLEKLQN